MQFRICARRARGPLAILAILLALPMLPHITGTAAAQTQQQARQVLAMGSGYGRQEGSRRVRKLQRQLNRLGYGAGPVDGRFGPLTRAAVLRFQRLQGLAPDGIAGPQTQARLRAARRTAGTVRRGSGYAQRGGSPRVRTVQRQLERRGYDAGPVDGLFGPRTQAAVLRFQRREGLARDGVVGPRTHARLAATRPKRQHRSDTPNQKSPPTQTSAQNPPAKAKPEAKPSTGPKPDRSRKAPAAAPPARTPNTTRTGFPTLAVVLIALAALALALATRAVLGLARQRRLERTATDSAIERPWPLAVTDREPGAEGRAGPTTHEQHAQRTTAASVGEERQR